MTGSMMGDGRRATWWPLTLIAAICFFPGAALAAWPPASGRGPCSVTKTADVPAAMRDGVILRADVYRPATDKPVPVILMRTQYGKAAAQVQPARFQSPDWFASHCYIVVIQDIRGQGASGGVFYEYAHDRDDGYDSVEWAAALPGSNGKVGMYGSSYVGATQWLAATAAPPHLAAIAPSNTASDYDEGWTYENGAFRLAFIEGWMTETITPSAAANRGDAAAAAAVRAAEPQIARWMGFTPYDRLPYMQPDSRVVAPWFFDALAHPTNDAYWQAFSIERRWNKVAVPVLAFDGWYDAFLDGSLRNFNGVREQGATQATRDHQRIVIGPWEHLGWGRADSSVSPRLAHFGPVADSPVNELMLAWFDHFLKGEDNGVDAGPRVDYYVMGENRWHVARQWPPAGVRYETWTLGAGPGGAASVMGDGSLNAPASARASDSFVYDPADPVPSLGGHSCCSWSSGPQGQFDQSAIEQRPDILVYSSAALTSPMEIAGPITVVLYASSTAPDTDFTAKLVDVHPDGTAVNLNNGILRTSFRESSEHPTPIIPGQVYRLEIKVWPTANLFLPGHKVRLEISSSDFPQFDPNPNTGGTFAHGVAFAKATQTIFYGGDHPSAIILPVIPQAAQGPAADSPPLR
jgi:putative CocE/NonD family hydrolase